MDELYQAVRKKAVGYKVTETVSEYAVNDGNIQMVKQKVTEKEVPPDLAALKMLKDEFGGEYAQMNEQELLQEKRRLLEMLKEEIDEAGKK